MSVQITNPNTSGITNLRATIRLAISDFPNELELTLPTLPSEILRDFNLPLAFPSPIPPGVHLGQVQFFVGEHAVSDSLFFEIKAGVTEEARLTLTFVEPIQNFQRGLLQYASINIQNTGTAGVNDLELLISASSTVRVPAPITLGNLAVGESKSYKLPFQLPENYPTDSAWLKVRVVDAKSQYVEVIEARAAVLNNLEASTDVEPPKKKDFVTAIWMSPNPDQYDTHQIVWDESEIILQIKVVSSKRLDKQDFCIEINGQPCPSGSKMDEVTMRGSEFSRTFLQKIKLQEGVTSFKVKVKNEAGGTETEELKIVYSPQKPNLHVIAIGIPALDLKYTAKDTSDFAKAIQGNGGNRAFQSIFIDTLIQEATTTKTEVMKALRRLQYRFDDRQITSRDLVVVFISSHGLSTTSGEFRIATSDYDSPFLEETSLDFEKEIINYLAPINCQKLFFIDACHSGATGDNNFVLQTPGTSITNLASEQSGLNIITSCRANEYSYEDDNWRNGAFTAALVKTFEQFAQGKIGLDKNDDKQLDIQELFQYIQTQVPQLVQQKRPKAQTSQIPIMMLAKPTQPIVLFELPKK